MKNSLTLADIERLRKNYQFLERVDVAICNAGTMADLLDLAEAQLRAGDGWMPIETAPKDGTWVIVSNGRHTDVARWSFGSFGGFERLGDILHWRPLPPPPAGVYLAMLAAAKAEPTP